jgi:hypothetical protein
MFAQIARDGDRLERLLLSSRIWHGPTSMDERREYLLFYVHILSSKINNDRCFGLRAKRLGRPGLRARRWLTSAFVCRFQNPDILFLRIKINATVLFSALLGPDNHGQAVKSPVTPRRLRPPPNPRLA